MNRVLRFSRRVIQGDFSQGQAFWAILVPSLLAVKTVSALLSLSNLIQNPVISARLWLPILLLIVLVVFPTLFFGCFRAIFIAKQTFKGGAQSNWLLGGTALMLYLTVSNVAQAMPFIANMTNIALIQDNMTLTITAEGETMQLDGQLHYGASARVKKWLADHPNTTTVDLNINSGHLHESRALAKLIIKHKLNTHVTERCAASCMLVLVAGVERHAQANAVLQFHRTHDYDNGYRSDWIIERERINDRAYYQRRAVDPSYLHPIYYPQKDEAYLEPGLETLLNVGVITHIE